MSALQTTSRNVIALTLGLLGTICASAEYAVADDEPEWRFGTARANITPSEPIWMAGYASRNRPADGKLTDLWAKALVVEAQDGSRAVLITMDIIGIDRGWSDALTNRIGDECGFERKEIAINTSHTHTGPVIALNLRPMHYELLTEQQQAEILEYSLELQDHVVSIVSSASKSMQPGHLSWQNGRADFAVNRRNNRPESDVPLRRVQNSLEGPVDHDVPVLAVHDAERKLRAVVFGYACHATVLSFFKWSGDYPGFAQIELEQQFPDCQAMFWAGCGGDQNPLPRRSVELAEHYGKKLANAVESVLLTTKMSPLDASIETNYHEFDLPFDTLPTREKIEADAESDNVYRRARAKMQLNELSEGRALPATYSYPIQQWKIGGEIDWLFLGGEVCVEYAARLKSSRMQTATWVSGYSNDVMAYIPSRKVWLEGGYEGADAMVYYGLPTRWSENVEQNIISEFQKAFPLEPNQATEPR